MSIDETVIDKLDIHGIPVLVIHRRGVKNAPLLVFSHGFTRSKEDFKDEMLNYSGRGFVTVSIDNGGHGERRDTPFFAYAGENGKLNVLKIRELINETAKDIPAVIDHFAHDERVDPARVGLLGVSMGGFIAFRALTLESRISAAAVFIASPEWNEFPRDTPLVDTPESKKRLAEYSAENSPVNFIDKFDGKKVLIQIGKEDKHFDPEKVGAFVKRVNGRGAGKMELIEYDHVAHEVTEAMRRKAGEWIAAVM